MKKTIAILGIIATSIIPSQAAFNLSGTSMLNAPGLTAGNVGVLVNLDSGTDWSNISQFSAGTSFASPGTLSINGTSFTILGNGNATSSFGSVSLGLSLSGLSYSGGFGAGDQFAILLFPNISQVSNPTAGTAMSLWRATSGGGLPGVTGWTWPTSEPTGAIGFATSPSSGFPFTQLGSGSSATSSFNVVPEPSTYALLAVGAVGLLLSFRRRKVQS